MMDITIPYKPRNPAIHAMLESRRFTCLVAHRRYGKTVIAVNHILKMALLVNRPAGVFAYVGPFRTQAKKVAWSYLKHYARAIPDIEVNETELCVTLPGGARIFIMGADNPDSLRGMYFDGVVLDEVAQMKPEVWGEIIQPALADRMGWAVFIGTPKGVNLFSEIYHRACQRQAEGNPDWAAMKIPVSESSSLPPHEVARLREELSDNVFRQEMLCDFSASSDDVLIELDWANRAFTASPDAGLASTWPLVYGVDIARFGSDATVFFPRRGLVAYPPVILKNRSNTDVAQRLLHLINRDRPAYVNIDQGQGTGVIDICREAGPASCLVTEVPFGSKALEDDRYFNRRAEMWAKMRDWIKGGGRLPDGDFRPMLLGDLTAPTYSFDGPGRLRLEAKDEIKKRLGRSTDLGDALALTFAVDTAPQGFGPAKRRSYASGRFNPFKSL